MSIAAKTKTALDEVRILVLGAQILLGFHLQCAFREGFDNLSSLARQLSALGLIAVVLAVALLIAPAMHHRLIEHGEDSSQAHRRITLFAAIALLPFAASLGLDLYVVVERLLGPAAALAMALVATAVALLLWYGIEYLSRSFLPGSRHAMATAKSSQGKAEPTPLHAKIEQMLTEARMILPGVQAILGFQLAITLTQAFDKLPVASQLAHLACLGLIAVAMALLMAPAAFHRIVYAGEDSEEFHRIGSFLVTFATMPLALGLAGDIYVVLGRITQSEPLAIVIGGVVLVGLIGLWHVYPVAARRRNR
jgi:hypothetical protein